MTLKIIITNDNLIECMNQNSNNEIVVDINNWLNFLDTLHDSFPDVYNDPDTALIGFEKDWEEYKRLIIKIKEK